MKYLKILALFVIFYSCQKENKQLKQISIEISEPINDFKINILWLPQQNFENIKLIGNATIKLQNIDTQKIYYSNVSNFHIPNEIKGLLLDENGNVINFSNQSITLLPSEIESFVFFMDINFDNEDELVVKETGLNGVDIDTFKFFEFEDGQLSKINSKFFDGYTNLSTTVFDKENKEIVLNEYYSCCDLDSYHYKLVENEFSKYDFRKYKKEHHFIDPKTNKDEITETKLFKIN